MEPVEKNTQENGLPETTPAAAGPAPAKAVRHESAWETVRSLIVILLGVICFRTFIAEATVIPTGSMEKTIMVGDHVFLDKLLYGPSLPFTSLRIPALKQVKRQEIVAFRYPVNPSLMFVKRVIGVGGDSVRIENKRVFVNGRPLDEPYVQYQYVSRMPLRDDFPPSPNLIDTMPAAWGLDPAWARKMPSFIEKDGLHVPQGYLFCMGDNRDNSLDSRFWGFVPLENVVGEPLFIYWSYEAPTGVWVTDGIQEWVKSELSIARHFISKTRWPRIGKTF